MYSHKIWRCIVVGIVVGKLRQGTYYLAYVPYVCILSLFMVCYISGYSQQISSALPLLTLNEALHIALEQNYGIQIAHNTLLIADNNSRGFVGLGAAGMLPTVNLVGGWNESRDNVQQRFFNGNVQERAGARTDRTNASIQLSWTLFDGLQMFAQRERLEELQRQSTVALRHAIETTIAQVMTAYVSTVEQSVQYHALGKALELSRERLAIAEAKARIGSASELDVHNARVDLHADSAAYVRQEAVVVNAKLTLLQILGNVYRYAKAQNTESITAFRVEDSLIVGRNFVLSELQERLRTRNALLHIARLDNTLAHIAIRQAESQHLPTINATANYNFAALDAEAGVIQTAQSNGLSFGITAQVNIFNGFNIQRQIENARVSALSAELQYQDLENRLQTSLVQTLRIYNNSRMLIELEQENTRLARIAAAVALEKFRLGTFSSLDLRQVQQNYIRAESRLITALADAKRAEIEIMRLVGDLVRE